MMSFKYIILFAFALDAITCYGIEDDSVVPANGQYSCTKMLKSIGLTPVIHYVTTEDGYILKLYNIPGNKSKTVVLGHGVFDSACGWFLRGNRSLGYLAAEQGNDLWVVNFRGNRYSRNHTTMNPNKDPAFWNFSAHEMGIYDLPAIIDYILKHNSQEQLTIVGFSEGTTAVLILGSVVPEYNKKVKAFIALAPIAFMEHVRAFMKVIIDTSPVLNFILPQSVQEIAGYYSIDKALINVLCTKLAISYELCYLGAINAVSGPGSNGIGREFLNTVINYFPAGTSRRNLLHFAQNSLHKSFCQYDHGPVQNMKIYDSVKPPVYDLRKMTIDTVAVSGLNDAISTMEDVEKLLQLLPNVVGRKVAERESFNHLDHMWGEDAPELIYEYVLNVLKEYN